MRLVASRSCGSRSASTCAASRCRSGSCAQGHRGGLRPADRDPARLEASCSSTTGSKLRRVFRVATGQSSYPTPIGSSRSSSSSATRGGIRRRAPPGRRARSPCRPGPGNPLGTRWMGISAPVRRHPRHAQRVVDRLLGLARLHAHADPRGRVAVRAGRRRDAGVHRPGMTAARAKLVGARARARGGGRRACSALLVWKVRSLGRRSRGRAGAGQEPVPRPAFTLERLDGTGSALAREPARQGGGRQLLGLVVRAVQGRGAVPAADVRELPRAGARRPRCRRRGLHEGRAAVRASVTA